VRRASVTAIGQVARGAFAGMSLLLIGACQARRSLLVTSVPPGAQCRLDGELQGPTPVEIPFEHYGRRRVTLYLDGYLTDSRVVDLRPPWYGYFPFDILSEVVLPVGWRDQQRVHVVLEPGMDTIPEPDLQSVLERAESLRGAGPEGPVEKRPQPGVAPGPGARLDR
jgi:hypothetical protein